MRNRYLLILMMAILFSSCEEALETALDGKKVTLLSPANNITTSTRTQIFYWEHMNGALDYQIQIVHPRFDSIARLMKDTIISGNQLTITLDSPAAFQWRVRAMNNSTTSDNSDTWNIKIQ